MKPIGSRNDRWPKRAFRNGYERTGTRFSTVGDDWVIPTESLPTTVDGFLCWIGIDRQHPHPDYPERPAVKGRQKINLEARLREVWDALSLPNRLDVLHGILAKVQPVWRARAILVGAVVSGHRPKVPELVDDGPVPGEAPVLVRHQRVRDALRQGSVRSPELEVMVRA